MSGIAQYDQLVRALVGYRHHHLYQNSAMFKTQVDFLANMLVPMVNGIAKSAEEHDVMLRRMTAELLITPAQARDLMQERTAE